MSQPRPAKSSSVESATSMTPAGAVPIGTRAPMPLARRFLQICTAVIAETLAGENLSPLQYTVLSYLDNEPDIDQNGLVARLGIDRTSTSQVVDQLEAADLVERRLNGADRRAWQLRLTPRGQKLRRRLMPAMGAANSRIFEPLTPSEREDLVDALIRVIENNQSYARPGAGRRKPDTRPLAPSTKSTK